MNIIELLKRQHEEVKDMLERMIAGDDARESRALLTEVSKALRMHMQIEEKMVYPAASRAFAGDEDDEETVLEAYEEHAVARGSLEKLEATAPNDKRFVVRAKVLKEILEKHIEEEENDLFPELEGKLGRDGVARLSDSVERKLPQLESEVRQAGGLRRGQRKAASSGPSARGGSVRRGGTTARRGAASSRRGATTKPRASRKGSKSSKSSSSSSGNGNKPRRGESTSRS